MSFDKNYDVLDQASKVAGEAWEKQPPFKENLPNIVQLLLKKGKRPTNAPDAKVFFIDTDTDKTRGYSGEINLEAKSTNGESVNFHHVTLTENGLPNRNGALRSNPVSITITNNKNGHHIYDLHIDINQYPEAGAFERPEKITGDNFYRVIFGNEMHIRTDDKGMGDNMRIFVDNFSGKVLEAIRNC